MSKVIEISKRIYGGNIMNKCLDVEKKTMDILKDKNSYKIPIDPVQLARDLKIEVLNIEFKNNNLSGVISKKADSTLILVNKNECYSRVRFTIAHELGHYFYDILNKDSYKEEYHRNQECNSSFEETRANNFAAALLMPKEFVIQKVNELKDMFISDCELIDILAKLFKVSETTMEIRLFNLGLIDE